ncbi:MAG: ribonuclease HII [Erysipelotrichaceae bacterium]|nr:ribonuclease HII [Erysipelotrichaceae bacterium]MBQ7223651.1 ribonuclease HII [Erysipelotrichaceae bacterium]
MKTPNKYELEAWREGLSVVGIDEAGRGPLAGPLVVAGVIFPQGYDSGEINDSKQLTEKKREALYDIIIRDALFYDIRVVEVEEIDRLNILEADRKAMTEIALASKADLILTDAVDLYIDKKVISLIKGDTLSCSIAAGSILAKVTRDRIMYEYDRIYPEYGFASHKGYGTKKHLEALEKYGVLPIHRKSYRPVMDRLQMSLFD